MREIIENSRLAAGEDSRAAMVVCHSLESEQIVVASSISESETSKEFGRELQMVEMCASLNERKKKIGKRRPGSYAVNENSLCLVYAGSGADRHANGLEGKQDSVVGSDLRGHCGKNYGDIAIRSLNVI